MENTRVTDRERYTKIAEVMPEYADWANKKIEAMDKRNEKRKSADRKPTKAQVAAQALRPLVEEALTNEPQTTKAIADQLGVNFQKITPILKALTEEGVATRDKVKGVMVYALATNEAEAEG